MGGNGEAAKPTTPGVPATDRIIGQYGCGPIRLTGTGDALYEHHDLIFQDHFSDPEHGIFEPLRGMLLTGGDHYMHLADLTAYLEADRHLLELYADPEAWTRKVVANPACSGRFSSDRTIAEYATGIWGAEPFVIPQRGHL